MDERKTQTDEIFTFSNNIKLAKRHIIDAQLRRYGEPNRPKLHEPVEEYWFKYVLSKYKSEERGTEGEILSDEPYAFLDIGSAMGYYCILADKILPSASLFAVEPLPHHIENFWETIDLNAVDRSKVRLFPKAVFSKNGRVTFSVKDYSSQISKYSLQYPGEEEIVVETISLSRLVRKINGRIICAKMDIQGAEADVLENSRNILRKNRVEHFVIGTHGKKAHTRCLQALKPYYHIEFDDESPNFQPDGIIVAKGRSKFRYRRSRSRLFAKK